MIPVLNPVLLQKGSYNRNARRLQHIRGKAETQLHYLLLTGYKEHMERCDSL